MIYLWLKLIHIISSTLLFGTGLGTAYYMFMANRHRDNLEQLFSVTRYVVIADFLFTTPAVILQPLTGFAMVYYSGMPLTVFWLFTSLVLYVLIGMCWLPVVWIQIKLRDLIEDAIINQKPLSKQYQRLYRAWFLLGWPAFIGVLVIYYLMVVKVI